MPRFMVNKKQIRKNNVWLPIRLGHDHMLRANPRPVLFRPVPLWRNNNVGSVSKRNLTWPQAQVRYPRMDPFRDADRDGIPNMLDCRPFNRRRHDDIKFDISGKVALPDNLTHSDISHEKVEKTQAEKDEILKNIIFKRLRQEFHEEKRKGKLPEDETYWEWVSERKANKQAKESKRISDQERAKELGLLNEDD